MTIDFASLTKTDLERCNTFSAYAFNSREGVQQTFLLAEQLILNRVEGCFVECGVASGAQIAAMSYACTKHGVPRQIHLFDSFEGIPLAGPHDHDQPGFGHFIADQNLPLEERLKSSNMVVCSVEQVQKVLNDCGLANGNYVFHKGWFQHTMPGITLPPIAFLRLDGDLYESTQCCLKWLYKFVVPGGVIFLDDYILPGSHKAFEEYFGEQGQAVPEVHRNVLAGGAYWTK